MLGRIPAGRGANALAQIDLDYRQALLVFENRLQQLQNLLRRGVVLHYWADGSVGPHGVVGPGAPNNFLGAGWSGGFGSNSVNLAEKNWDSIRIGAQLNLGGAANAVEVECYRRASLLHELVHDLFTPNGLTNAQAHPWEFGATDAAGKLLPVPDRHLKCGYWYDLLFRSANQQADLDYAMSRIENAILNANP